MSLSGNSCLLFIATTLTISYALLAEVRPLSRRFQRYSDSRMPTCDSVPGATDTSRGRQVVVSRERVSLRCHKPPGTSTPVNWNTTAGFTSKLITDGVKLISTHAFKELEGIYQCCTAEGLCCPPFTVIFPHIEVRLIGPSIIRIPAGGGSAAVAVTVEIGSLQTLTYLMKWTLPNGTIHRYYSDATRVKNEILIVYTNETGIVSFMVVDTISKSVQFTLKVEDSVTTEPPTSTASKTSGMNSTIITETHSFDSKGYRPEVNPTQPSFSDTLQENGSTNATSTLSSKTNWKIIIIIASVVGVIFIFGYLIRICHSRRKDLNMDAPIQSRGLHEADNVPLPSPGDVQTLSGDVQALSGNVQALSGNLQALSGDVQALHQAHRDDFQLLHVKMRQAEGLALENEESNLDATS
eukprot:m.212954 g.212954  ORF g.212954 m.212954 type:complete len:410 (+) comp39781_c0_seq1:80-1309(+)